MFAQIANEIFKIKPVHFGRPPVAEPVAEEPIKFCEDTHMEDLGEIIERDERTYNVFASIVDHATAWAQ